MNNAVFLRSSLVTLRYTIQTIVEAGTQAQYLWECCGKGALILQGGDLDGQLCYASLDDFEVVRLAA